ncbi:phosphoribosylformylglycinamidine synthase [Roseibacillus persicicus]|uniref:Phosphoribosylformylglycinamidine synthase n=1 Tax=Roseibacillus persicicus TaxID=454148 RepID=A0A918WR47_9BACT|nr:phosphoribosylformylglycinamidine synthase [Roseibacillus persicicus]GHC66549.1 phosphoribosylformylglycinamidine synthase [Roseibacillus persicicus]
MHALYVEKRPEHNQPARTLLADLRETLDLPQISDLRILQRYFVDGLSDEHFAQARELIFSEPFTEVTFDELPAATHRFAIEFLPGQFDQRADSAAQCVAILTGEEAPPLTSAQVYLLEGDLSAEQIESVKSYLINPVDSHEASLEIPATLTPPTKEPADVAILIGFIAKSEDELAELQNELGLAMTLADLAHTQSYFRDEEQRDPSLTEIKLLDTYWSDHCRHTTFLTKIEEVTFGENTETIRATYEQYQKTREALYGADTERPETMMDLAIIAAKELKKSGELDNLEISEEINAASIIVEIPIQRDGEKVREEYLIQFKNETHNHPTEIEPFGGAATCLGGCIRDPLSGRAYVYQAMRVTGAWDPRTPFGETMANKLPQRKICLEAARGYSSYGNQIGLATGQVSEIYHPGYLAKRMEIGAVVAACPRSQVQRGNPEPGDIILLIGGRTGRDGVGGATGSSKEHTDTALENSAEVQKGNAPTERKVQRLFRNPELSYKIKRCNDFGAGGVSVAIGELADSLDIDLDAVPKKYQGLDGTELAISESQERMAVVVDPADVAYFIAESDKENLECVEVAQVTDSGRLNMTWRGQTIVSLTRDFIETNGVQGSAKIHINPPTAPTPETDNTSLLDQLASLNLASQKGLGEMFDSSIGAGTVLSPFGGKNQITPPDSMVAKVPVLAGETDACTHMAWAFDPKLSSDSPFHGSVHAVAESVCKVVATGARLQDTRLTFQEYFPKLGEDPARWGLPFSALLGAFHAQHGLRLAAIGGKDSMSGSFKDLDVPPTLVSFALAPGLASLALSPEFKQAGSTVSLVSAPVDAEGLPLYADLIALADQIHEQVKAGKILSLKYVGQPGVGYAAALSCLGNGIGSTLNLQNPQAPAPYTFILETPSEVTLPENFRAIGSTTAEQALVLNNESTSLREIEQAYTGALESVYRTTSGTATSAQAASKELGTVSIETAKATAPSSSHAKPKVLIPVFPGTNCEYDSARVFEQAGAESEILVFRNLTPAAVEESLAAFADSIRNSQILFLPGGFSSGDEPDGSAKFIATILRNPQIADAIADLHETRQGLILGICNGFQALVKSGLLTPSGSATLTHNPIARHISTYVTTRVANTNSPWLANCAVGDLHTIPVSHGEGRFLADEATLASLVKNGQIATQYCDAEGQPSLLEPSNPNQSALAIEGITSPCGRIFGKMGHTERRGANVAKNIPGNKHQPLFKAGVQYFA